jgi:hypothetical protein
MAAASITGVFTILDRATGPMRKMELQAAKTMAAIEGLGKALDKQSSSKHAQQNEKLARSLRDVERAAKLSENAVGNNSNALRKSEQDSNRFVAAMQRIRDVAGGVAGMLGALKFGAVAAGLGLAFQAAVVLGGGVVALIPRIADLAGVMAAIPSAAGAMAQGVLSVVAAMSGVTGAIGQGMKEASAGAGGGGGGAQMAQQAAQNSRQLMLAYRAESDAQKALTQSRIDAKRELIDLAFASRDAVLGQQSAALSLQEARNQLEQAQLSGASDLSISQATLGVSQAELGVDQANELVTRSEEDKQKAFKKGIAGSDQVVQAQRQLSDSIFAVTQAQQAMNQSMAGGGGGGMSAFAQAMQNLSPEAQAFVKQVIAMKPAIQSLRAAAGKELFPQLGQSLTAITKLFPVLRANFQATGGVIGATVKGIAQDATTPRRLNDSNLIMQSQTKILGMVGNGFRNLISAVTDLMVAARPFTEWLFKTVEGWTATAKAAAAAGRETGGIAAYLDRTKSSMQLFGSIIHNVWDVMKSLGQAARPLGDLLWGGADKATQGWATFLKSAEGAAKARAWFDSLYEPLHALGQLAKVVAVNVFGMTKDTSALTQTANALQTVVPPITELLTNASNAFGPGMAEGLASFARILNALPFGPLQIVLKGLTTMLDIVADLLEKIPGLGMAISLLLTVSMGTKVFQAVGNLSLLSAAWGRVTGSAITAAAAQEAAAVAGGGGLGAGGAGKGASKGFMSKLGGKTGGGLALGLGGSLVAGGVGSAVGGDTGSKISTIGGNAAMGAGVGTMILPGWGTAVGAIGGALFGAIQSGLFKGGDRAKEAGSKAAKDYLAGLGAAGIDPKTGRIWKDGLNPFKAEQNAEGNANTALVQARDALAAAQRGRPVGRGGTVAPNPAAIADATKKLNQAENNASKAFVQGITKPLNNSLMNKAEYVVESFGDKFNSLSPQAQMSGAKAMVSWAKGMESSGKATKGFAQRVFSGIAKDFDGVAGAFGGTGRKAMRLFNAEIRSNKAASSVKELLNQISTRFGDMSKLPGATTKNWSMVLKGRMDGLRKIIADKNNPLRDEALRDFNKLKKAAEDAKGAADKVNKIKGPTKAAQDAIGGALRGVSASFFGADGKGNKVIKTKVQVDGTADVNRKLQGVTDHTAKTKGGFADIGAAVKKARDDLTRNSISMQKVTGTQTSLMVTDFNTVIGRLGGKGISVAAMGARLPRFESGGRIPGAAKGDHVPLVGSGGSLLGIADGGELVVNRHTEKRVNKMLASHGTSLGGEVAGETKPHYAMGGRIDAPTILGGGNQKIIQGQREAGNLMLSKEAKQMNKNISEVQKLTGLGSFDGKQVANWIVPVLQWARGKGWGGGVTSGYRSNAKQAAIKANDSRAAAPGASNHNSYNYPGGAIDVGGFEAKAEGGALNSALRGQPFAKKLRWGDVIRDYGHFSADGHAYGGRLAFAGWHGRGVDGTVNSPTMFGAGENGPERVRVTPLVNSAGKRGGKAGNIEVHIANIHYSAKGDVAKAIREEMELLSDELAMMDGTD